MCPDGAYAMYAVAYWSAGNDSPSLVSRETDSTR